MKASNMGTHTLYSPDTACTLVAVEWGVFLTPTISYILFIFYIVDKDSILAPLSGVTLMIKAFQFIPYHPAYLRNISSNFQLTTLIYHFQTTIHTYIHIHFISYFLFPSKGGRQRLWWILHLTPKYVLQFKAFKF